MSDYSNAKWEESKNTGGRQEKLRHHEDLEDRTGRVKRGMGI